jgi:hypothetical protein
MREENSGKNFRKEKYLGVKHGEDCMAASVVGNIHFINGIMNKHVYVHILQIW